MKFFAVFAAVVAIASASPNTWTLRKLDAAIANPLTSATFKPVLLEALNAIMDYIYQGHESVPMVIKTQAGPIGTFNLAELGNAIESKQVDSVFKPYLEDALNEMMESLFSGQPGKPATVEVPAFVISSWTLQELDEAVSSADTREELRPYLIDAMDRFLEAVFFGEQLDSILVAYPAEIFDLDNMPSAVVAEPVAISPNPVNPIEIPVSTPLVQIIVNVQNSVNNADYMLR